MPPQEGGRHLSAEWGTRRDPLLTWASCVRRRAYELTDQVAPWMSYGARSQPELPMPLAVRAFPCMPLSLTKRLGFAE